MPIRQDWADAINKGKEVSIDLQSADPSELADYMDTARATVGNEDADTIFSAYKEGKTSATIKKPPAKEGIGLENFMDVAPIVKTVREGVLKPVATPVRQLTRDAARPLLGDIENSGIPIVSSAAKSLSTSVPAQVISGIPGTMGATLGEFAAQNIEQLPENIALMGAGKLAKGTQLVKRVGRAIESKFPSLVYRGGYIPAGKEAFGALDVAKNKSTLEIENVRNLITKGAEGKPLSLEERQFIGSLTEQPSQRAALLESAPDEVAAPANWSALAEEVPNVKGQREIAGKMFPEVSQAPVKYAEVADKIAQEWGLRAQQLERFGEQYPDMMARMYDRYLPRINRNWSGDLLETMPRPKPAIRERAGFLKERKNLSDLERRAIGGFIEDPAVSIPLRMAQEDKLIRTRELFEMVAENPLLSREAPAGMKAGRKILVDNDWFVKMPESGSLGPIKGRLVRLPESKEINLMSKEYGPKMQLARKAWQGFKFGKTIASPKTWLRNFIGNGMMAHAEGLSPYRIDIYRQGKKELVSKGGQFWNEAKMGGADWTVGRGMETDAIIGDDALNNSSNIMDAFAADLPRWSDKVVGKAGSIARKVANVAGKVTSGLGHGYQDTEAFFKHSLYIYLRKEGVPITEAIKRADGALLNYDKMPVWVKRARSAPGGIPFISFSYGVTPLFAKAAAEKPMMLNQYRMFRDSWNEVSSDNVSPTDKEKRELSMAFKGTIPLIMPWRDSSGSLVVFDSTPFFPLPNMLPGRSDVPFAPGVISNLATMSPAVSEVIAQGSGYDPFYKTPFTTPVVQGASKGAQLVGLNKSMTDRIINKPMVRDLQARGMHLASTLAPEIAPGGRTFGAVYDAVMGRKNFLEEKRSTPQALVEAGVGRTRSLKKAVVSAKRSLIKQVGNAISGEKYDAKKKIANRPENFVTLEQVRAGEQPPDHIQKAVLGSPSGY